MPRLSDTMERGTIVSWNVKEGQKVSAGDVLGDIETDKATMELQNFDDGVVAAILLSAGQTIEVGKTILVLAEKGEDAAAIKAQFASGGKASAPAAKSAASGGSAPSAPASSATAVQDPPASSHSAPAANGNGASNGGRVFASPLAKKIAEERGVDLGSLRGSGPSGRIVRADVEAAASTPKAAPAKPSAPAKGGLVTTVGPSPEPMRLAGAALESRTVALNNMRGTIAKRLVESKTTIPHYQVTVTAAMDRLLALRTQLNDQLADQGVKLSVNDFLVRACALAMHQHPFINASWGKDGQSIQLHGRVNVGVAVALPAENGGGLVVATLRDADRMGLRQISQDTRALADKARAKGLTIDEMSDSTFTISNLGMFGVEHFTAIINPPNSAILAVGAAVEKPVVREGKIVVGHEMQMTMSSDHRVIDGAMAAQYLATVRKFLENPATLLV
jgi:pyruvate dehydrogenase E2 component (dihydrolipoamide acetyltransferase)